MVVEIKSVYYIKVDQKLMGGHLDETVKLEIMKLEGSRHAVSMNKTKMCHEVRESVPIGRKYMAVLTCARNLEYRGMERAQRTATCCLPIVASHCCLAPVDHPRRQTARGT